MTSISFVVFSNHADQIERLDEKRLGLAGVFSRHPETLYFTPKRDGLNTELCGPEFPKYSPITEYLIQL